MTDALQIDLIVKMIEDLSGLSDNDAARIARAAISRTAMSYKVWQRADIEAVLEEEYASLSLWSRARVSAAVMESGAWRNGLSGATEDDWYLIELAIEDALRELQIAVAR